MGSNNRGAGSGDRMSDGYMQFLTGHVVLTLYNYTSYVSALRNYYHVLSLYCALNDVFLQSC